MRNLKIQNDHNLRRNLRMSLHRDDQAGHHALFVEERLPEQFSLPLFRLLLCANVKFKNHFVMIPE